MSTNSAKIKRLAMLRKLEGGGSSMSTTAPAMTLQSVENMFVEKLSEKYRLTERDIKRVFTKFDKDGSGAISVAEMTSAIRMFVQGVDPKLVTQLVAAYDVDGDGEISLDEFTAFLISRNSPNKADWITVDQLMSQQPTDAQDEDNESTSVYNNNNNSNSNSRAAAPHAAAEAAAPETVAYRSKIYLQNLKSMLLKKAMEMRLSGKIPVNERMSYHTPELAEIIARNMITKSFQPYVQRQLNAAASAGGGGAGMASPRVDYKSFAIVVSKLVPQGAHPPTENMVQYLFQQCCGGGGHTKADPDLLVDMVFMQNSTKVNKFGFIQPQMAPSHTNRPEVGPGPFQATPGTTTGSDSKLMLTNNKLSITNIPYRIMTKHCKTSLATPSDFTIADLERSGRTPSVRCSRDFVYGMNGSQLYSGNPVRYLEASPAGGSRGGSGDNSRAIVYTAAALVVVYDVNCHKQWYFEGHSDDVTCFTVSKPIHWDSECINTYKNTSMIRMGGSGSMVRQLGASGQLGRSPCICVWETWPSSSSDTSLRLITKIGKGFFQSGVCAVEFSPDGAFICGISCDEKHSMGIWNTISGALIADNVTTPGIPPAVKSISWSTNVCNQNTHYITGNDQSSASDVICTGGVRHLKFWAFQRPTESGGTNSASLLSKLGRYGGKFQSTSPALYLCVAFLDDYYASSMSGRGGTGLNSAPVVAGADNGGLYCFNNGMCTQAVQLFGNGSVTSMSEGVTNARYLGVCCLEARGSLIYCGGSTGAVKIVDCENMSVLQSIEVSASVSASVGGATAGCEAYSSNPITGGGSAAAATATARPRSAATPRGSGSSASAASKPRGGNALSNKASSATTVKKQMSKEAWGGPRAPDPVHALPEGVKGSPAVVGLCLLAPSRRQQQPRAPAAVDLVAITGFGKSFVVKNASSGGRGNAGAPTVDTLMYYHYAPVWAVASVNPANATILTSNVVASGGDDKWICVWDNATKLLLTRARTIAPIRCLTVMQDPENAQHSMTNGSHGRFYLAVGTAGGSVLIYSVDKVASQNTSLVRQDNSPSSITEARNRQCDPAAYSVTLCVKKRDCKEDISDIKFSSNSKMLAVGSHDNFIDIYAVKYSSPAPAGGGSSSGSSTARGGSSSSSNVQSAKARLSGNGVEWRHLKRLRGHSSFVTHIDWSCDNRLLRSTCGAYELLYWDVGAGRQILSSTDNTEADTDWATDTTILGFEVMGIWKPASSGDDINALCVDKDRGLVFTADDYGSMNCFNFPCVVANAPHVSCRGHSSHVMNIATVSAFRGSRHGGGGGGGVVNGVVTVGGNDNSVIAWGMHSHRAHHV